MWDRCQSPHPASLPEWVKDPGAVRHTRLERVTALDGPVLASLGAINLSRRSRRALAIGIRDHSALVVTDHELLVLTRRGARTRVAARYPRRAAKVTDFRTLPPGGDFLVDRLVINVGDVAVC